MQELQVYVVTNCQDNNMLGKGRYPIYTVGIAPSKNEAVCVAVRDWANDEEPLDHMDRDTLIEYVEKGYIKNKQLDIKNMTQEEILKFMDDIGMNMEEFENDEIHIYDNVTNYKDVIYLIEKRTINYKK